MYVAYKSDDRNEIIARCNYLDKGYKTFDAVYDTGAESTCVKASDLDIDDISTIKNSEVINVAGFGGNNTITCYKKHIIDFYLGNIHLTGVDIWITFDESVDSSVIGYDILSRVTRLGLANSNKELLFKDNNELIKYVNEHSAEIIEEYNTVEDETKYKYTREDLISNYIHRRIKGLDK